MGLDNTKDKDIATKFDCFKHPQKQAWFLKPLAGLLSFPDVWARKSKITKYNMEGLKHPYLLLCTHHAFLDFKVTTQAIFPKGGTFIVAVDGFIGREGIMRKVGCIGKRKFVNDSVLVRNMSYSINKLKQTVVLYPEARYCIAGTNSILPESLGKLAKLLKVPVVVLNMHGHYINNSVWNLTNKKVPIDSEMTQIVTAEEITKLTVGEINCRINKAFEYNEYQWQLDRGILVKDPHRAEGLQKVLYRCPHCNTDHSMSGEGVKLSCSHCGISYLYNEDGTLSCNNGETLFSSVPEWYEWERELVKEEIISGKYCIEDTVDVDCLANSKGFVNVGRGKFRHDNNGVVVEFDLLGEQKRFVKTPLENYSTHIEFAYNNKGDCVSFTNGEDTYYFYFDNLTNVIVKLHLAVEELYKVVKTGI